MKKQNTDAGEVRRPALRVVSENSRGVFYRPHRRFGDTVPIILPEINLIMDETHHEFRLKAMGLTDWQINRAWRIVNSDRAGGEVKYPGFIRASDREFRIWTALGETLDWERREILAILREPHPAMTRRIMKGLQREGR